MKVDDKNGLDLNDVGTTSDNRGGLRPEDPDQSDVSQEPRLLWDEEDENHEAYMATATPTAKAMLAWFASQIGKPAGYVRENVNDYTQWYYGNNTAASWCYIFMSFGFNKKGALTLIHQKCAYVPNFKGIFQPHGEYHVSNPKVGDLVVFDFNHSGTQANPDPEHIGIVEKFDDNYLWTIEGNTGNDVVARRKRARSYCAYASPKYATVTVDPTPDPKPTKVTVPSGSPALSKGDTGTRVGQLQTALNKTGAKLKVDKDFGSKTESAVKAFQKKSKLLQDGVYGTKTASALKKAVA